MAKQKGGANRTLTEIVTYPIPAYRSNALDHAVELADDLFFSRLNKSHEEARLEKQARIDALIWMHFGFNDGPLDIDGLSWMLDTQFDCLNRCTPQYRHLVVNAFKEVASNNFYLDGPTGKLFDSKVSIIGTDKYEDKKIDQKKPSKNRRFG